MTAEMKLRLLACQIAIPGMVNAAERDAHLLVSAAKVGESLAQSPADLVVLPELSSLDYSRETFDHLGELAEALDGPSFRCWREVAVQFATHIVYSFVREADNRRYICVAVVDPTGNLVGYYDKIHLAQYGASMEKEYFQGGDHLFTFRVKGFKLAPIICYDIRFPELSRSLVVDHQVDVILHCGAYYRDASFYSWPAFATTRALENQVFLLSLNRAGNHYGNSLFCWPWMDENSLPVEFPAQAEQFLQLDLDRTILALARKKYAFLEDRLSTYALACLSK